MKSNFPLALLFSATVSLLVCSCTIANQEEDVVNDASLNSSIAEPPYKTDKITVSFLNKTRKCILGDDDKNGIDEIIEVYQSSIADDSKEPLLFQDENLTVSYEKCVQKAISEYGDESGYFLDKLITSPFICARLSQRFYAKNDLSNGAFWARRLLNMVGVSRGYLMLGNAFVKDPKTLKAGAALLAEAAELGNETALYRIQENLSSNNIFSVGDDQTNAEESTDASSEDTR